MCIIYYVYPNIYVIMLDHKCVLYITYAQVYMLLWWIINVYFILCMSKYIFYGGSSMCIIYYVCPNIYVIMLDHQCVLCIMYVQVYMLLWWIINVYFILWMSKYIFYGGSSMCIIYYVCPNIYVIMLDHQCVLYIMYVQVYMLLWWIINVYYILCMIHHTTIYIWILHCATMLVPYNRLPDDGTSWPETCGRAFVKLKL